MSNFNLINLFKKKLNQLKNINISKNRLIQLSEILRHLEIGFLAIVLVYMIIKIFTGSPICINSPCPNSFLGESLWDLVVVTVFPIFAFLGLSRVLITYTINDHDNRIEIPFYLGLIGLFCTFLIFAFLHRDFYYIYAKNTEINSEPVDVTLELLCFLISGMLLLWEKRNWDKSVFFVKARIIFYILLLVFLTVNINFGIVLFLISIPFLIWADLKIGNHYHYELLEEHFPEKILD